MEPFDLVKVLRSTLKGGARTSEFWITLLTLAMPVLYRLIENVIGALPPNSTAAIVAGALYVAFRSILKALAARKALDASPIGSAGAIAASHELKSGAEYRELPPAPGMTPGL